MWQLLLLGLLTACQTMDHKHFGLSEHEWNNLQPEQKSKLTKKYWQVKKQHVLTTNKAFRTPFKKIEIKLVKGTALMWPEKRQMAFMPVRIILQSGACKEVELFGPGKISNTVSEICYDGKQVSIDPSHWQLEYANGALVIARHHLWHQGMVYQHLNSKGYAGLRNVSVSIRSI